MTGRELGPRLGVGKEAEVFEFGDHVAKLHTAIGGISRAGILAWLPFVAAARLAEGVPAEAGRLLEPAGSV